MTPHCSPNHYQLKQNVAVVIPCYRVRHQIERVLGAIGDETHLIFVVDDACPEGTADFLAPRITDPRVRLIRNTINLGVGGAVKAGYRAALKENATIIIKLDGDGQMDPRLIPSLIAPLVACLAHYVKGDRFHTHGSTEGMPLIRYLGNRVFSLMARYATGIYEVSDVLNGFTAITREALELLPLDKIADDYFFESDMLFQLGRFKVPISSVPMSACYGEHPSSLRLMHTLLTFPPRYITRTILRPWSQRPERTINLVQPQ